MKDELTVLQAKRFGVFSCKKSQTLGEVVHRMVDEDISTLIVVDDEGSLAGIITRTDLLRAYIEQEDWRSQPVMSFMKRDVVAVPPSTLLSQVAKLLLNKQIHRVVVVREEEGKRIPLSVVSAADLIYHMAKE